MIAAWFGIASFMLIVYVALDGRNFGAGMLHWLVARTPEERRQVIAAIGPLWSWHEVWLVGFGGTLLAVFPKLLASAFAGYYLALFLIVWCLILRGVSLEVGGHIDDRMWQEFWDFVFVVANTLLAVLFGAAAGNLARGVPLTSDGTFSMAFFSDFMPRGNVGLLDWYTVSVAIFAAVALAGHGATYLTLRTEGDVHDRSERFARVLWAAAAPLLVVITIESAVVRPDLLGHAIQNPYWWLGLLLVCAAAIALVAGLATRHEMLAFIGSNLLLAGLLATLAAAIFPVVLHSTLAPKTHSPLTTSPPVPIRWRTPRPGGQSLSPWRPRISFSSRDDTPAKSVSSETTRVSTKRVHQQDRPTSEELTMDSNSATTARDPRIIIVGGGFGGLAAARALRKASAQVLLIDKTNHHVFQPLLYQVATSVLSPEHIAAPLRHVLRRQANITVLQATVTGVDVGKKVCFVDGVPLPLPYDYLVLATGVHHSYFGHDEYAAYAPGVKTVTDAVQLRNKILGAFEACERTLAPHDHPELLTFVIVGGGPTGVELAGAIAELARQTLAKEFRRFDPASLKLILVEAGPRILSAFAESLADAATAKLAKLGVEVRTGAAVEKVDAEGVIVRGERIGTRNVFWAAGVKGSPAAQWLGAEADRAGRVKVLADCSVPGHPEIFVVGDTACLEEGGKPLPGVAQVAIQQGRYVGRRIARRLKGKPAPPAFKYFNKGNLATVGRNFAVMEAFGIRTAGLFAKMVWAFVHIQFLVLTSSRIGTLFRWSWKLLTRQRLARLIIEPEPMQDAIQATPQNGQRIDVETERSRSNMIAGGTV